MTPTELDDRLDGELQRLPAPAAPPTLLPRVMEAVEKRAHARWYRRAWVTWPAGWQVVSASGIAALVAGLALALPDAQRAAVDLWSVVDAHVPTTHAADLLRIGRQVAALMRVSWEVLLQPIAAYVAVLVLAVSLGCTAFWTALNRLAPGGASRP
jgi:hypothetical protein